MIFLKSIIMNNKKYLSVIESTILNNKIINTNNYSNVNKTILKTSDVTGTSNKENSNSETNKNIKSYRKLKDMQETCDKGGTKCNNVKSKIDENEKIKKPFRKRFTEENLFKTKHEIPDYYIKAIEKLNSLQSNLKALKESANRQTNYIETKKREIDQVNGYLNRLNVTKKDLEKLSIIHISGTKGKGSTSAYCESILRSHGYSTGFYSSPHLIEVRERIKINGKPLDYEKFTTYFWHVYDNLYNQRTDDTDMPAYFKFLTIMSYYVFLKEKLDVCIVEVGIGGLFDSTNIIPNTPIVGITSLGYDHMAVLGNTIEEITKQKAGIMKPNCIAITSTNQKDECKITLLNKSKEMNCLLLEAPHIQHYKWKDNELDDDWTNTVQSINISLAIQLAYLWMYKMNKSIELKTFIETFMKDINKEGTKELHDKSDHQDNIQNSNLPNELVKGPLFEIDNKTYTGLKTCVWPGRLQIINKNKFQYFLDGAHTMESIELCSDWFKRKSEMEEIKSCNSSNNQIVKRILVFNITGDREPSKLLPPLLKNSFDYILVTPNILHSKNPDIKYVASKFKPVSIPDSNNLTNTYTDKIDSVQHIVQTAYELTKNSNNCNVVKFTNVLDTYNYKYKLLNDTADGEDYLYHVLVTGSLHLVGAFLNVLQNSE